MPDRPEATGRPSQERVDQTFVVDLILAAGPSSRDIGRVVEAVRQILTLPPDTKHFPDFATAWWWVKVVCDATPGDFIFDETRPPPRFPENYDELLEIYGRLRDMYHDTVRPAFERDLGQAFNDRGDCGWSDYFTETRWRLVLSYRARLRPFKLTVRGGQVVSVDGGTPGGETTAVTIPPDAVTRPDTFRDLRRLLTVVDLARKHHWPPVELRFSVGFGGIVQPLKLLDKGVLIENWLEQVWERS